MSGHTTIEVTEVTKGTEPQRADGSEATGRSETVAGVMCKCGAHLDVTVVQGYGVVKPCVACAGELAAEMVGKMIEPVKSDRQGLFDVIESQRAEIATLKKTLANIQLTRRDAFGLAAMLALVPNGTGSDHGEKIARMAMAIADAMIKASDGSRSKDLSGSEAK